MVTNTRREDKGIEMRTLITPARIVTVVIFLLFSTTTYLAGRTWDKTSSDTAANTADIVRIDKDKLDVSRYERDCETNRIDHEGKANKEDLQRIDRRLTMILDVMIDPSKKEQIRKQQKAMKARGN